MMYAGYSKVSEKLYPTLLDWVDVRKAFSNDTLMIDVADVKGLPKGRILQELL